MEYGKIENWGEVPQLKLLTEVRPEVKELFYRGNYVPDIFKDCVTIVGSRRMTEYGRRVIEKIVPQLVMNGKTIVSGFMYGVDQYAHKVAIEFGGKTVAILGWGMKQGIGVSDQGLAKKIIETGGLLMSEWEDQVATLWSFPKRDRILAAVSSETIVIEAAVKSGSLITAGEAIKLNRTVWAVPGPITSKVSEGTNKLIAEGNAKMWLSEAVVQPKLFEEKDSIMQLLANEDLTADEISRKLNKPVAEVGARLSMFVLMGRVKERSGKFEMIQ